MTIKTIKPSGGDFTTLSAWEASLAATLAVPQQADVYNFGSSGLVEIGGVAFTGFTTTTTNRIIISSPVGERHNGVAHSGAYLTCGASGFGSTLRIGTNVNYLTIDWFEVEGLNGQTALIWQNGASAGNNQLVCQHTILHGVTTSVSTAGPNTNYIYRNSFIYTSSSQRQFDCRGCASCEISNCTFLCQGTDFNVIADAATVIKNCYSGGATNQCFYTGNGATGSFNCSSDTSATTLGSNSIASQAGSAVLVSATSGSEDLRMKTGSNALFDAGTTIAAVTDDIIGTTRPQGSAYDIGGFERVVSSGITGSAAWVEAQDIWAGTGTVVISGAAAWTEAQDVWSATGTVIISGAAAWVEAQDIWAGTGTVIISGAAAWTEGRDVWAGTGTVVISGAAAWTEANDIWSATGTVFTPGITGSAAWTEGTDIWSATGTIAISGSVAWTEGNDAWAIIGTITLVAITGSAAWTEIQDAWAILTFRRLLSPPPFDMSQSWSVDLDPAKFQLVAYNAITREFLVVLADGNFALWTNMPLSTTRAIQYAKDPFVFLHNLTPPTIASYTP